MTAQDIIKPENLVYSKPSLLNDNTMHYCPGCSHGVVHKLIAEVIEEMGEQESLEGCLSVKNSFQGYVNRPAQISVKASDRYGDEFVITGTGYLACALSHETDHLKGVLFIDKLLRPYSPESKGRK